MIGKSSIATILFLAAAQLASAALPIPRMECECVCADQESSSIATAYMLDQAGKKAAMIGFQDHFHETPAGTLAFSGDFFDRVMWGTPQTVYKSLIEGCKSLEGLEGREVYNCDGTCDWINEANKRSVMPRPKEGSH